MHKDVPPSPSASCTPTPPAMPGLPRGAGGGYRKGKELRQMKKCGAFLLVGREGRQRRRVEGANVYRREGKKKGRRREG
eukprot:600467-Hanusia_phi.AAC.4